MYSTLVHSKWYLSTDNIISYICLTDIECQWPDSTCTARSMDMDLVFIMSGMILVCHYNHTLSHFLLGVNFLRHGLLQMRWSQGFSTRQLIIFKWTIWCLFSLVLYHDLIMICPCWTSNKVLNIKDTNNKLIFLLFHLILTFYFLQFYVYYFMSWLLFFI